MEINNNDVFPQNLVDALEKIDRTIEENSGNLDENINISVNATGNTKNIDNSIIDLNKQIDETLNTLDRGVNEHKGAFDIWKTFGVELDSSAFGNEDANKDRVEKDSIYDQLSLLAKAMNKDPKLLGTLTSLNKKHLKIVIGEEGKNDYLDQAKKVIGLESGIIDKRGYIDHYGFGAAGFVQLGHSVIASTKTKNQTEFNSTLFHEYGHLLLQKALDDIGVYYKSGNDVNTLITKLKSNISHYKRYTNDLEREIHINKLFDLQLSGKISENELEDMLLEMPTIEEANDKIRKTKVLLNVFKNINNNPEKYANENVEYHEYINDAHEVFARSFKNYVSGISNITGNKRVDDHDYDIDYTHGATDKINDAFMELFATLEGRNISKNHKELIDKIINKKIANGLTSGQIANIIRNINYSQNDDSRIEQLEKFNNILLKSGIDISSYNFSSTSLYNILQSVQLNKNDKYYSKLLNIMGVDIKDKDKINKLEQIAEVGGYIDDLKRAQDSDINDINDMYYLASVLYELQKTLHKTGYDNLSLEEIRLILSSLEKVKKAKNIKVIEVSEDVQKNFKNMETSLDSALSKIPSSDTDENIRAEVTNKVKEQCDCLNGFENCIKSLANTFKTQFESAIDNSANAFKLAFESAITSYGDVLARVSSGKNPFTADTFTGGYKQEMIMAERGTPFITKDGRKLYSQKSIDEYNQAQLRDSGAFVTDISVVPEVLQKSQPLLLTYDPSATFAYTQEKRESDFQDLLKRVTPLPDFPPDLTDTLPDFPPEVKDSIKATGDFIDNLASTMETIDTSNIEKLVKYQRGGNIAIKHVSESFGINGQTFGNAEDESYSELGIRFKSAIDDFIKDPTTKKYLDMDEILAEGLGSGANIDDTSFIKQFDRYNNSMMNEMLETQIAQLEKDMHGVMTDDQKESFEKSIEEWGQIVDVRNKLVELVENDPSSIQSLVNLDKEIRESLQSGQYFNKPTQNLQSLITTLQNGSYDDGGNGGGGNGGNPPFLFNDYTKSSRGTWMNGKQGFDAGGKTGLHKNTSNLITWYEDPESEQGGYWKINVENDAIFKNYKEMMDLNEAATHMQKHMEDFWRFQFSNKTNPELAPLEYLNAKYAERADYLKQRMENTSTGFASTIYKIGGQEHTYQELLSEDPVLTAKIARMNKLVEDIKHANDIDVEGKSTNPLTTYMWLRELSEVEKDIKKRTANVIKEQQTIYKELSDIAKEGEKIADDGIKQADKMLAGDSSYKSIFGKYKIPELSRSGKFRLTSEEYQKVLGIEDIIKTKKELLKDDSLKKDAREKLRNEISALNKQLDDYTTGQIADRAREISKIEDHYKKNVMPSLNSFNRIFGHVFNTNADLDYEKIRQGGFGKLKELTKLINVNPFTLNDFKRYMSNFSHYASGMFTSGVKMFQSASAKIGGILTTAIKTTTIAITGAVASVTAAVTGFVAGFTAMGKSIISATDIYRKQTIAITGVYQSPSKANQMINSVYNITRGMPIDYTQAVQTLSEMSAIPALQTILKSNDSQKADALLNKMFKVITAMTTMRPDQRSSDAIFSLRNAFAGDLRSLQRRFDLPTANIMNVRGTMGLAAVKTDPMALLDSLENYFDTFLDVSTINKVSDTISVIITKIKGAFDLFKANIGNSGFYDLVAKDFRKIRDIVLNFVTSDEGKSIAQRLSDVFSNVYNSIKSVALKIKDIISQVFDVKLDSLPDMFTKAMEFFAKSVKYIDSLLNVDKVVFYVKDLTATFKELKKQYEPFIEKVKSGIKDTILMILKVSDTVLDVVGSIITTLKQTGLNDKGLLFLWLFGPGNVISLIGNGVGAITSGIMAAVAGTSLLVSGFKMIAGVVGIANTKLLLIVGTITTIGTAIYDLITSFDKYSKIFDTIIDSIKVEFDQMLAETNLPGSNAAKTRLLEGSGIAYRGSIDDVIKNDLENYLKKTDSWFNSYNNDKRRDIIKSGVNDIYYADGLYRVNMDNFNYLNTPIAESDDPYKYNRLLYKREELQQFVEYLNGLTDSFTIDTIARQKRENLAKKRSELFGQTKIGQGINTISDTFNTIKSTGGGIWNFVKGMFVGGGSIALDKAEEAQKKAKDDADEYKKLFENYMTSDGQFDLDKLNKSIIDGSLSIKDLIKAIKSTKLDRISADPESKNYEKHLRSIAIDIENTGFQRGSAFVTRFKNDDIDKAFSTEFGDFGAKGIEQLNTKRLEAVKSVYNVLEDFAKTPTDWSSLRVLTTMPMTLKRAYSAIESIDGMIYDTVVKSVDIIRETMAKKNNTYLPNDVVNYVMVKRKDMENEIMSEILGTLSLQHSVYFATTNEISGFLNKMEREYKGDMNGLLKDISAGNVDAKELSDTGKQILTELANRYNAERDYYDNLVKQRSYIEVTSQNIGKMSLAAISQNWSGLMNSPYRKIRETAGNVYLDRVKEGLEEDSIGSMVRKVRDIAIESFTDMKTAIINAVQDTVKSTQQTIKNGLDRLIADGGTMKGTFKEVLETIKKNFFGIYTNKAANDITEFIYGSSFTSEKENPMNGVEQKIVELNDKTSTDIKTFQSENNTNFIKAIAGIENISSDLKKYTDEVKTQYIKGTAYADSPMGSRAEFPSESGVTRSGNANGYNNISDGAVTRLARDIGKDSDRYDDFVNEASKLYDIESSLIKAVINTESSFRMLKENSKGAIGLMQVTNGAANDVNRKFGTHYNVNNPRDNIMFGTAYLRMQMDKFGDTNLALAAYNAGAGNVIKYKGIPPFKETQNYIPTVNMFRDVFAQRSSITRTGEKDSVTKEFFNTLETVISPEIKDTDTEIKDVKTISDTVRIISNTLAQISNMPFGASIYAPTINNMINNVAGGESIGGLNLGNIFGGIFGGLSGSGTFGETGIGKTLNAMATAGGGSGVFGIIGDAVSKASGLSALKTVITASNEKKSTPLKGIWGNLFGTIENVEAGLGHSSAGSFIGNMMAGKGIWDSLASASTIGADTFESLKGANSFTKVATGLTSTLFGKSAGAKVAAKLTGTKILGASLGTAIPVVGAVASVLSKKGWFGGAKDRTAEGRARGEEFNSLRNSLIANRSDLAKQYYMANASTLEALQNYQFGNVAMWTSKRGSKWKGTRRRIMNTDATDFIESLNGWWDLILESAEEQYETQRRLNKLQNSNMMEYLKETGDYERKKRDMIMSELDRYKGEAKKYAGHDTGFTQTLFDGKTYTLTELENKIEELTGNLADSNNTIIENEQAIQEQIHRQKESYENFMTEILGEIDPLRQYNAEIAKLEADMAKNTDGQGYEEYTAEWWDYQNNLVQATKNLENAAKELKESILTDWTAYLKQMMYNGHYDASQVRQLAEMYRNRVKLSDSGKKLSEQLTNATSSLGTVNMTKNGYSGTAAFSEGALTNIVNRVNNWNKQNPNNMIDISGILTNTTGGTKAYLTKQTTTTDTAGYKNYITDVLNANKGKISSYGKSNISIRNQLFNSVQGVQNPKQAIENLNDVLSKYGIGSSGTLSYSNGKYYYNSGIGINKGNLAMKTNNGYNYALSGAIYELTEAQAQNMVKELTGKTLEDFKSTVSTTSPFKIDEYALASGKTIADLLAVVSDAVDDGIEKLTGDIEHQIAANEFANMTGEIKTSITELLLNTSKSVGTVLQEYVNDIQTVMDNSVNILAMSNSINSADEFQKEIISPIVDSLGATINDSMKVFETLYDSGFKGTDYSTSRNMKDYITKFVNNMNALNNAFLAGKDYSTYLANVMSNVSNIGKQYELARIELNKSSAKQTILSSLSGYEDYEIANKAITAFNQANKSGGFGTTLSSLLGLSKEQTSFTDSNMSKWFGVSGEDPYETYYEWQKKTILQRIRNEQEGSDEWYQAELDLWNLMQENAKYLKDKAEKTSQTIEDMLDKINETVKTRVAEEAKTSKGDIIFIDLGSTRGGGANLARQMLNAVKTQDPDAQKLIQEYMKKMGLK